MSTTSTQRFPSGKRCVKVRLLLPILSCRPRPAVLADDVARSGDRDGNEVAARREVKEGLGKLAARGF